MPLTAQFARLALLALLPASAWAYRPLVTDDTGTQGSGGNQLELGYDHASSDTVGAENTSREIPFTYTRGIADNLDLFAGIARVTAPAHGWSNVGVGGKWRFYEDEASKISLALKPEILLPVSSDKEAQGLGVGRTSYGMALILTKETGFGELHFNLASERDNFADRSISDRRNLYRVSMAPVWNVAEQWKIALDLGLQTNPDRAEKARMGYVELGMVYSHSKDLDISLGLMHDLLDGAVRSNYATFGLTWRFK